MATQDDQPGSFILEVAAIGESLISAYTRFIVYRKVGHRGFENLYATLSITSSMLLKLGNTVNKYKNDFQIKDNVTRPACEKCKTNFETLLVMINEGNSNKGVWKSDGTIGGQSVTTETDPWLLITVGLGGREAERVFWKGLDDTRDTLIELNDVVKYMALKHLNEKESLNPSETIEFENLREFLPHLAQSHEKGVELRKRQEEWGKRNSKRGACERRLSNASFASRDSTVILIDGRPRSIKDLDTHSISSSRSSLSIDSLDGKPSTGPKPEIYEEWQLKWFPPIRNLRRSWSFLGLRIKGYFEDRGFWDTDPELRTQAEMKEQHDLASANLSPSKHREAMQKAIQSIPKYGGFHIDQLLEERAEASSIDAKRVWSVVAVRPKQKLPYSSKKKWGKDPRYTNWLITIKGETVDNLEQDRRRSTRPVTIYPPPRVYRRSPIRPRNRGRYMFPPPPPRSSPGLTLDEEYEWGKVVVGKIMSVEEAEKRMDGIWAEMTAEKTSPPINVTGEVVA